MKTRRRTALGANRGGEILGLLLVVAFLLVLQLYPVRALLAAELIFAALFAFLAAFAAALYLVGSLGESGADAAIARMHATARSLASAWHHFEIGVQRAFHRHHAPNVAK